MDGAGADGWLDSFPPIHLHLCHTSIFMHSSDAHRQSWRPPWGDGWGLSLGCCGEREVLFTPELPEEGDKDRTLFVQQPCPCSCEATALPWPCPGLLITVPCFPARPGSAFGAETFQSREKKSQI